MQIKEIMEPMHHALGLDYHHQAPAQSFRASGGYYPKPMTPKQVKARQRAKLAKQARKRNR